jgi:hypothetical protein
VSNDWVNEDFHRGYETALNDVMKWLWNHTADPSLAEAMREGIIRFNRSVPKGERLKVGI